MNYFNKIKLWWWKDGESNNFGDYISVYLTEKISKKKVVRANLKKYKWYNVFDTVYFVTGSILENVEKGCVVWGSGMMHAKSLIRKADFRAVRGRETWNKLIQQGHKVPEIFGDPAILLPLYYKPKKEKKYELGIIPHYVDYLEVKDKYDTNTLVINLLDDVEKVIDEINSCEFTVSSSLHGLIVAHTYNIPSIWVEFSDKVHGDGFKFRDYFSSVGIDYYNPMNYKDALAKSETIVELIKRLKNISLPKQDLEEMRIRLLNACPFKK